MITIKNQRMYGRTKTISLNCPKCGKPMQNMGNISRTVLLSNPPQWDETYVCHDCKIKKTVRVYEHQQGMGDISSYTEWQEKLEK